MYHNEGGKWRDATCHEKRAGIMCQLPLTTSKGKLYININTTVSIRKALVRTCFILLTIFTISLKKKNVKQMEGLIQALNVCFHLITMERHMTNVH